MSVRQVEERGSREGWAKLRDETVVKTRQKLPEKISETLADVNARQARLGKVLQGVSAKGLEVYKPRSFEDVRLGILIGITIERKALGLDLDQAKDEVYQKFQQFTFIFNLNKDELQRFIDSIDARLASLAENRV